MSRPIPISILFLHVISTLRANSQEKKTVDSRKKQNPRKKKNFFFAATLNKRKFSGLFLLPPAHTGLHPNLPTCGIPQQSNACNSATPYRHPAHVLAGQTVPQST
ncbi:hypothetical protein RchiOBHm_Chr6g0268831 [Rosa chinensis]|uniref:Secreted protein n=1 Tax=Rosa chinensis TaxID=74649 RepID=A0A2P6PQA6_ROSCH|nr:hypothetical protein RchiOBHm_Chr6g0268831 [Rosa chinensis]